MNRSAFRSVRVVGVEDGSFQKGITQKTVLTAVLLKGLVIEDVKVTKITVDGLDATEELIGILSGWKFDAVMLAGVSFAGFNIADPIMIHKKFREPVIVVLRKKPDSRAVKRALQKHFEDWQIRWAVFEKLGSINKIVSSTCKPPIYVETLGARIGWVSKLVRAFSLHSRVPEPVRIARLIARGLS